jgi:peptidoglycan-associated lipoprotein
MKSMSRVIAIASFSVILAACSTRHNPAGVSDVSDQYGGVQTQGLGKDANLVGPDGGPTEGKLGTRSFYFDFDKSDVNPDYIPILQAHAGYLKEHPQAKVLLEGNTDSRGSREYNIALGQRRAEAVNTVLHEAGVPVKQTRTLSYGAEKPIAQGQTESDYQVNRRADLRYEENKG